MHGRRSLGLGYEKKKVRQHMNGPTGTTPRKLVERSFCFARMCAFPYKQTRPGHIGHNILFSMRQIFPSVVNTSWDKEAGLLRSTAAYSYMDEKNEKGFDVFNLRVDVALSTQLLVKMRRTNGEIVPLEQQCDRNNFVLHL